MQYRAEFWLHTNVSEKLTASIFGIGNKVTTYFFWNVKNEMALINND